MMSHLTHAIAHLQRADARELLAMDRDERRRAAELLKTWLHVFGEVERMEFADLALAHIVDGLARLPDSGRAGVNQHTFKSGVLAELQQGERAP